MQKEIGWLLKEKYSNKPTKQFYKDVERLNGGEPLDYVIGFKQFLGCRIDLSKKPLIPRPETEYWVEKAINDIIKNVKLFAQITRSRKLCKYPEGIKFLDIFAGSGCVGVAISRHVKNAKVTFADKYKYFNSPNFIKSDVFSNIKGKYDYIFANPPYVAAARKNKVQESVLKYEPKHALFAGKDGLFYIKKFLKGAKKHLRRPSSAGASAREPKIFMEFAPEQKEEIEKIIRKCGYQNFEFRKDQFGRWRWVRIT